MLFSKTAAAQPQWGGQGQGDPHEMMAKKLKLTEEQKAVLDKFRDSRSEVKKAMLKIKLERLELNDLLKDPGTSDAAVRKQVGKINKLMTDMNNDRIENLLTLRKTLSKEQFKKLLYHIES